MADKVKEFFFADCFLMCPTVNYRLLKGEGFQLKIKVVDEYGAGYVVYSKCNTQLDPVKIDSKVWIFFIFGTKQQTEFKTKQDFYRRPKIEG